MNIFWESPWLIVLMGTMMTVMLLAGLLKTGRLWLLGAALAMVVLTGGLLVVERLVVTTREEIAGTLDMIANQLQRGAHDQVVQHIASSATSLRQNADRLLPRIEFHEVRIKPNLKLLVEDPRHLTATFNAVFVVSERGGAGDHHHVPSFFKVEFVREGDAWKVTSYERSDPRDGMRQERF